MIAIVVFLVWIMSFYEVDLVVESIKVWTDLSASLSTITCS